jgi:hypothetical protein
LEKIESKVDAGRKAKRREIAQEREKVLLREKEEKIWAEELQHRLQEAGEEEALKAHQLRADKQQAVRFEDELDFQNFIFNNRGERSAAKKNLKSKSKK